MSKLKVITDLAENFTNQEELSKLQKQHYQHQIALNEKKGKGNEFLGWYKLPAEISEDLISDIENTASNLKSKCDKFLIIGIGGSYLGARAVIEALKPQFSKNNQKEILYAGHNLSEDYLFELKEYLKNEKFAIIVISKSGTTTEPAVAFRIFKKLLEENIGKEKAAELIIAITDKEKGALKTLANNESYKTFIVPDDVGGRYSVLSPVGLLPIALAGINIREIIKGSKDMMSLCSASSSLVINPAAKYSSYRNLLYQNNFTTEIMVSYEPNLFYFMEWWKQLFGESEGKENKGIFPAAVSNTTDLHSMGQYIQQGRRELFETVISIKEPKHKLLVDEDTENLDGLNYLCGKQINSINKKAKQATALAHFDGGVPNLEIQIEKLDEHNLGQLIYFFEISCAFSGYTLGVNPFDQPGVEDYKRNMFALLGKPGFEKESKEINKRIKE
jgi:glucose-6-phosphate isomerase